MKKRKHLLHGDKVQDTIGGLNTPDHKFWSGFGKDLDRLQGSITPIVLCRQIRCGFLSGKSTENCFIAGSFINQTAEMDEYFMPTQSQEAESFFTVCEVGEYSRFGDFLEDLLGTNCEENWKGVDPRHEFLREGRYVTTLQRAEELATLHLAGQNTGLSSETTNCFFVEGKDGNVVIAELNLRRPGLDWEFCVHELKNWMNIENPGEGCVVLLRGALIDKRMQARD